jgi:5-formyltetrahydrofolate cyclo-ligase
MVESLTDAKAALRADMLQRRRSESQSDVESVSQDILLRLEEMSVWRTAEVVHTYASALPGEIDTIPLMEWCLENNRTVVVPVVNNERKTLTHCELKSLGALKRTSFGLLEPEGNDQEQWYGGDYDVVITPGLAFDRCGRRLGMGGGYYDRFFAETAGVRIALASDWQIVDAVPTGPHDQPVNIIVTESQIVQVHYSKHAPK